MTQTHYRTHTCGQLREAHLDKEVILCGWLHRTREHGNVTFLDIRDRYGITQVVADESLKKELNLKKESVIQITGTVKKRPEANKNMPTGAIELHATKITLLNPSETLPLDLEGHSDMTEETRLKYRYLDLRRHKMQENLITRHKAMISARNFFDKEGFVEIETPMLAKSTPEGARDFLVPSRLHKGKMYALPQSPQIFKQLLMLSGFDRYIQFARCFRDEDLRADRQTDFTQIDLEMSFVQEQDIYTIMEKFVKQLWKDIFNQELPTPFPRLTYEEAMNTYGKDSPDRRFELHLHNLTTILKKSDFTIFKDAEYISCIILDKEQSRKEIDKATEQVKIHGAKGLAWVKITDTFEGGISKFLSSEIQQQLRKELKLNKGKTIFFVADQKKIVLPALGNLRLYFGKKYEFIKEEWNFTWITDFPLLDWNQEEERYVSMHHPFTAPKEEDISLLETTPEKAKSNAYDLVLNGVEIAGGSIRIHKSDLQKKMFHALNIPEKEAEEKFGFLINAFKYGAPPHGGIAFGFDRLIALITKNESIREVIAFPKTKSAEDLMMESPSDVSPQQLKELGLKKD